MKYEDFENIMTYPRMRRYFDDCGGNTKRAMTLYRKNLHLSQELFTVISCFEISIRNSIDKHCIGKPVSTPAMQYNQTFVFNQLMQINNIRNRIAHHEPICFEQGRPVKSTAYSRQHYGLILQLFQWMGIDEAKLLYGLDHINSICNQIDVL